MIDAVASFLQLVLSSSSAIGASQAGSATMWALLLATAIIVVLLQTAQAPMSVGASLARAERAIDQSAAVTQSDPDAPGHPRSRAPGLAAPAA